MYLFIPGIKRDNVTTISARHSIVKRPIVVNSENTSTLITDVDELNEYKKRSSSFYYGLLQSWLLHIHAVIIMHIFSNFKLVSNLS
jgi:hypothetical protein